MLLPEARSGQELRASTLRRQLPIEPFQRGTMRNNVGLILAKRAHLSPGVEGFIEVESGRRFTYAELNGRCNRVANALRAEGVKKGDRVALLLMNSVEFFETFFAVAKIGAINVPLNWRLVPDELAFILKDSGSTVMIYGGEFVNAVADLQGRGPEGTDVGAWIQVGAADARAGFAKPYEAWTDAALPDEPEIGAEEDDELYIMYTSGTTGLPKGAVHTHDTAIWASHTINATADLRYRDRYIVALPMFHVGALSPLTANVHRGVTNHALRAFDPSRTWETIDREGITVMLAVPAMLNFMLQVPEPRAVRPLDSCAGCMSGAAPSPRVALIEAYAEDRHRDPPGLRPDRVVWSGLPHRPGRGAGQGGLDGEGLLPHRRSRGERGRGRTCEPRRDAGEVIIARQAHIMKGYWNRPDATAETDARRLALLRRPRHGRRGGLRLHPGPHEGHDHLGRVRTCTPPRSRT